MNLFAGFLAVIVIQIGESRPNGVRARNAKLRLRLHGECLAALREEGREIWERQVGFYHHPTIDPYRPLTLKIQSAGKEYNPAHEISVHSICLEVKLL